MTKINNNNKIYLFQFLHILVIKTFWKYLYRNRNWFKIKIIVIAVGCVSYRHYNIFVTRG